jgi:hypothetical protein
MECGGTLTRNVVRRQEFQHFQRLRSFGENVASVDEFVLVQAKPEFLQ